MNNDVLFTRTHEWVKLTEDGTAYIGITDHGQELIGNIFSIELPERGLWIESGVAFADIEGVNLTAEIYSPVGGIISDINEDIIDEPDKINESPYEIWLVKIDNVDSQVELLDEKMYRELLDNDR